MTLTESSRPAYIAGVTNPIFEASANWDLLCDIGSSRMVISKDIHQNHPTGAPVNPVQLIVRSGTLKAEGSLGSEEEISRPSKDLNPVQKADFVGKVETADNIFMEDVSTDPSFALSKIDLEYRSFPLFLCITERPTSALASLSMQHVLSGSRLGMRKMYLE